MAYLEITLQIDAVRECAAPGRVRRAPVSRSSPDAASTSALRPFVAHPAPLVARMPPTAP